MDIATNKITIEAMAVIAEKEISLKDFFKLKKGDFFSLERNNDCSVCLQSGGAKIANCFLRQTNNRFEVEIKEKL